MNTGGKCKSRTYSGFYTCLRLATGPITVLATFLKKPHKNAIFHPINIGYLYLGTGPETRTLSAVKHHLFSRQAPYQLD